MLVHHLQYVSLFCLQANMDSLEGKDFSLPAAKLVAELRSPTAA